MVWGSRLEQLTIPSLQGRSELCISTCAAGIGPQPPRAREEPTTKSSAAADLSSSINSFVLGEHLL
ncbi:hypothetical protein C8T65DRAFT_670829, partial [Cerioporus squamosus]